MQVSSQGARKHSRPVLFVILEEFNPEMEKNSVLKKEIIARCI